MVVQKEDYAVFPWCSAPEYIIELVCDVITLKMDALSKQLHQAPVFGQDTDVTYLYSCDLNTKFDQFTGTENRGMGTGNGESLKWRIFKSENHQFVNAFIIEDDLKTLTFADYCKPLTG